MPDGNTDRKDGHRLNRRQALGGLAVAGLAASATETQAARPRCGDAVPPEVLQTPTPLPAAVDHQSEYLATVRMLRRLERGLLDLIQDSLWRADQTDTGLKGIDPEDALLLFDLMQPDAWPRQLHGRSYPLTVQDRRRARRLHSKGLLAAAPKGLWRCVELTPQGRLIAELVENTLRRQGRYAQYLTPTIFGGAPIGTVLAQVDQNWRDTVRYRL